jgi:anti-anti-sigma factor
VRAHGRVGEVPEAGPSDHVCWVYDDVRDLDAAVGRFLTGGLARGERLLVVGEELTGSLGAASLPFGCTGALAARGALQTLTLAEAYDPTGRFVPEQQLAFYEAATRRAIDDGYRGLRVVAEGSALAGDPAHRPDLVRWEHLADDLVAHGPGFTALCAYRGDLDAEALGDVASVHPVVHTPDGVPPFQVFFDDGRVVVAGSVDTFTADRLATVLAATPVDVERTVLDLGRLDFIDAAGCRVLAQWAHDVSARPWRLQITGTSRLVERMWRLLTLDEVAPVAFAGRRR